jgi:hypothetical protein
MIDEQEIPSQFLVSIEALQLVAKYDRTLNACRTRQLAQRDLREIVESLLAKHKYPAEALIFFYQAGTRLRRMIVTFPSLALHVGLWLGKSLYARNVLKRVKPPMRTGLT